MPILTISPIPLHLHNHPTLKTQHLSISHPPSPIPHSPHPLPTQAIKIPHLSVKNPPHFTTYTPIPHSPHLTTPHPPLIPSSFPPRNTPNNKTPNPQNINSTKLQNQYSKPQEEREEKAGKTGLGGRGGGGDVGGRVLSQAWRVGSLLVWGEACWCEVVRMRLQRKEGGRER